MPSTAQAILWSRLCWWTSFPTMSGARRDFGPVMVALPFGDVDDLARRANDTLYGLGAGVWTKATRRPRSRQAHQGGTVWVTPTTSSTRSCVSAASSRAAGAGDGRGSALQLPRDQVAMWSFSRFLSESAAVDPAAATRHIRRSTQRRSAPAEVRTAGQFNGGQNRSIRYASRRSRPATTPAGAGGSSF